MGSQRWYLFFELTDSGVGDLDLQLVGDAGEDIRVKIDQYNDEPDIGVQIASLMWDTYEKWAIYSWEKTPSQYR